MAKRTIDITPADLTWACEYAGTEQHALDIATFLAVPFDIERGPQGCALGLDGLPGRLHAGDVVGRTADGRLASFTATEWALLRGQPVGVA